MPSPKKRSHSIVLTAVAQHNENAVQEGEEHDEDERIVIRRVDMVQRRQIDLDNLMDHHDDLVREAFQLDKFVTLLSYDPKVAKSDNSKVFLEYKGPHDLLSKSAIASGSAHISRKTRRAAAESRESLAAAISAGPSTPPVTPSPSKGKERTGIVPVTDSVQSPKNLGRGKMQAKDLPSTDSSSTPKGKGKGKELLSSSAMPPPPSPFLAPSRRDHHPRRAKDGSTQNTPGVSEPSAQSVVSSSRSQARKSSSMSLSRPSLDKRERTRRSLGDLKRESLLVHSQPSETLDRPSPPVHTKTKVKRVTLFQRPRPALYTHPSQLPPRPLYHNSMAKFLTAYTSLEDGVDASRADLDDISITEAKTRARIRDLRQQGRLLLDIPDLPDGSVGISSFAVAADEDVHADSRVDDHYDHVVSAAVRRGPSVAIEYSAKRLLAKRLAKSVMAWHGTKESNEEKQRKAEAIRLKTLAKLTIKEVEKQWKKAVMAIRDHNRAILEAEEARIGRKHLDAILDQSGAILEAQHTELSRARSRSSSARDWSESGESDDNMEEGENLVDAGTEYSDEVGIENDEADASLLLGTDALHSFGSEDPSIEFDDVSAAPEIDDTPYREFHPRDTSPRSESSPDILPSMSEDMDLSLATTPSEDTGGRPSTGAKTIPSSIPVVDTPLGPADEENDVLQGGDVSEGPSEEAYIDPITNISGDDLDLVSTPLHSRQRSYRSSMSPPVYDHLAPITQSSSPSIPSRSSQPHPQTSLPMNTQSTSSATTLENGGTAPVDKKQDSGIELSEDKAVAVRLSNGVVIYRKVDVSSPPEPSSSVRLAEESITMNGRSRSPVLPGLRETGLATGITERGPDDPAEIQENIQHEADSSPTVGGSEPTDRTTLILDAVNGVGNENPVEAPGAPLPKPSSDTDEVEDIVMDEPQVAAHLLDFAAAPVEWDPTSKVNPPFLLRGTLRPYQQSGLEWLASLHTNNLNGILADEMGLGKTIQTISLLAHLACDQGIWGPHLIVVPTSVLLNWEMEFKKFLPGFKILPYHGSTKRRKELRVGWNNKHSFNVCVTSYTLASRDAHIFKRKSWYYMILDEAHMIKNFKSQRWNILLMFRSFRRLLLTGTPLQNNLTELWALLQFLMSGTNFANLKEFGDWFSNPLEKAIEQGTVLDEETQERVRKLHTVLRPYLLRRLKADVEKELPSKYEHLVMCRLSKRQRFLYDEFMSRAQTRDALASGVYHKVANILMQLRKVCNHPNLFEVRPIVTSFAMPRSATVDFEIKELLIRRRFLKSQEDDLNLDFLGLVFVQHQGKSMMQARSTRNLDASSSLPLITELPGEPPPVDTRTIAGFKSHLKHQRQLAALRQWTQMAYVNRLRCAASPVYGSETIAIVQRLSSPLSPLSEADFSHPDYLERSRILSSLIKSYEQREEDMAGVIDRFAFMTPPVVSRDLPSIVLSGFEPQILHAQNKVPRLDAILHRTSVKLQIAFPDASLIQYDCGKLQELASLLHKRKAGGHRILIFTQMTKVLDILEIFLNFHGYRYLRLDGATRIEDRQYITERFNNDDRVFAFIASSRSGGVGINLTGADTVVFYDSDFNPQMDRQCEDRAHRIGQIRDVHIYRFISEHTVEESMLRKANQKRSLDNIVIQQGEFDWRSLLIDDEAFGKALGEFEDKEDAHAARVAAREEAVKEVEDNADFAGDADDGVPAEMLQPDLSLVTPPDEDQPEEDGTIADYMLAFVKRDWEWFSSWR